jgi:hypothetical protein
VQVVGHEAEAMDKEEARYFVKKEVGFDTNRGEQGAQQVGHEAEAMDVLKEEVGFDKNYA